MIGYYIFLANEQGQKGYLADLQDPVNGRLLVCADISGATRFDGEEQAEKRLYELEAEYGLNREEANIEPHVVDDTFVLRLGGANHDDGVSVVREGERRFITVHNMGLEASEELPDEVADLLVRVLWKVDRRLGKR
jgi:hypothetical protein